MGVLNSQVEPMMDGSMFVGRMSLHESLDMLKPITDSESREAMFAIGNDKSPGCDGFSAKFFKASWNVVGSDVMFAVREFFSRSLLLRELSHTVLCFIQFLRIRMLRRLRIFVQYHVAMYFISA